MPDLHAFYEAVEAQRAAAVAELVARHRSLPPLLLKVEEAALGTATGAQGKASGQSMHANAA